jgi:hypothetical protein
VSATCNAFPPGLFVDARSAAVLRNLDTLAGSLSSQPTTLRTLVLPRYLTTLYLEQQGRHAPVGTLIEVCVKKGIAVLWEEGGGEFCVNEAFWAWVKAKKSTNAQ